MRTKLWTGLLVMAGLLLATVPLFAEGSFVALFDGNRAVTVTGVIARVDWTEPNVAVFVDAKDAAGTPMTYMFASESPAVLHQAGVRMADFKVGETVTVTAAPAKDKTAGYLGWMEMIKYHDGHVLVFRSGSE